MKKTLEQLCAAALLRAAEQPAVMFEEEWTSWGQMRQVADSVRQLLRESGAADTAAVTFVPRNRPSALATLLALMAQGRHIRMLYPFQSASSLARQIEQQKPPVVIAAARDFPPEVMAVMRDQGSAGIVIDEMGARLVEGCERSTVPGAAVPVRQQIDILTSGTTGTPKSFPVSYAMIAQFMVGEKWLSGAAYDSDNEPAALLYFPIGNITGIHTTVPALIKGQRIVLLDRFSLERWHEFIVRFRPPTSGIPPTAMGQLLDANIPRQDLSSLKSMGSGAAPLDPALHKAFEQRYGIPILLSYGATEFGGPVSAMTIESHQCWGDEKFGSVGRAFPGFQLRVVDPDSGEPLTAGQEGVLEVVSPRIGSDWIRTSDIALIDSDGFLYLKGRADGAIMRGGFKVLPETIERALLLHPSVAAVSVVAVADERVKEVPGAAIQCRPGVELPDEKTLEAHLRESLLATHIPVHWRFVDSLPKTPSFKIDRPAVERLFLPPQ
ncbi:long-chain fatty acid--CoA ligase [Aestuariicella hydrocarbonica]|uniref:Long-chain fatty acid--CoA ligase n=1 Tax=Pseudomaricurvus hydrocarbonicus TaxID=1470433 RepID=A0A9E5MNE6_9GAMM|nr:fatty acid--CoA ligase family protein [Aestuariicella hydrocarbonica]NHO67445.1 long-chain fatty acid--CoA ligase [Aestuariicella hydrocarbonica]